MIKQKSFSCWELGKCDVSNDIKLILKNCTDNGNFVNGKCKCNSPYIGADCATEPIIINTKYDQEIVIDLKPWNWIHYSIQTSKDFTITVNSGAKLQMYTYENELPTPSFYDSLHNGPQIQYIK